MATMVTPPMPKSQKSQIMITKRAKLTSLLNFWHPLKSQNIFGQRAKFGLSSAMDSPAVQTKDTVLTTDTVQTRVSWRDSQPIPFASVDDLFTLQAPAHVSI